MIPATFVRTTTEKVEYSHPSGIFFSYELRLDLPTDCVERNRSYAEMAIEAYIIRRYPKLLVETL